MPDEFDELLERYMGEADDATDIRTVVRRLWFYDFLDCPVRVWQGKGILHTTDGNKWFGTIDANDVDHHSTPKMNDGRDGSSQNFETGLPNIIDTLNATARETYYKLRDEQYRITGCTLTCYIAIFNEDEGLRPKTPISFFREFEMINTKFEEDLKPDKTENLFSNIL
jgi:hypothetical protein